MSDNYVAAPLDLQGPVAAPAEAAAPAETGPERRRTRRKMPPGLIEVDFPAADPASRHGIGPQDSAPFPEDSDAPADSSGSAITAFSQDQAAARFAGKYKDEMRFVAAWGKWFTWTGERWAEDATLLAFDRARKMCRAIAHKINRPGLARTMSSAATVAAVGRLAQSDRRLAALTSQWDSDPWLLNTPGGIVDLRTGHIRPHDPTKFMIKMAAIAPGGECPLWLAFLKKITGGDASLAHFLQRVAGLALTGITRDHALFFGHGPGANGKSVLLNTICGLMGDYAVVAAMETFTASPADRHPTDLAMLRGARLVTSQETEEGRRWAESRIKSLTGGDPIAARFMRQDFFTFTPSFKLFIAGNHKPVLRGVDEALRRRFNLIPFAVTIPVSERDSELPEKLKAEWPGILQWAIEGCLDWQTRGLAPPPAVTAATDDYLDAEDSLAAWLGERTRKVGWGGAETMQLFADWSAWAKERGEDPLSAKRFVQALASKGLLAIKNGSTRRSEIPGVALADMGHSHHETANDWA